MGIISSEIIETFFEQYPLRHYKKGQVFILGGERSDYLYLLMQGRVKMYDISYRGDEIILHVYKPPALFPVSHALTRTDNKYIYEADTDTTVRRAPLSEARKLLKSNPLVALDLLKQLYERVDQLHDRETLLMSGSAKGRLIYELIAQCRQFGAAKNNGGCQIDLSEKDLGAHVGLSRETVSREAKKLERKGLIIVDHKSIIIPRLNHLEAELRQLL